MILIQSRTDPVYHCPEPDGEYKVQARSGNTHTFLQATVLLKPTSSPLNRTSVPLDSRQVTFGAGRQSTAETDTGSDPVLVLTAASLLIFSRSNHQNQTGPNISFLPLFTFTTKVQNQNQADQNQVRMERTHRTPGRAGSSPVPAWIHRSSGLCTDT